MSHCLQDLSVLEDIIGSAVLGIYKGGFMCSIASSPCHYK
jgi:hypothetical protein